ncbi:MAG: tetratricopeptide repeat protein [Muribaculaceae bacterium]|nr:tetratricopeptide repeat protein [Muribaculaceae bacterium]
MAAICSAPSIEAQVNADQVMQIGRNALYFEDYMLSIQYFNQAIVAKPYLAQPYLYRAIAKLNLQDYRGAEADASKAIELNPFLSDAWEVRGVARQNLGKDTDAIADYDEALTLLPHNRQLLFNKAIAQSGIKDYEGAENTFGDLIRNYPGYENAYLGRARLHMEMKDTVAALADVEKALNINRNAVSAYVLRADIAANSGHDFESAESDISQAIKLQPHEPSLYINRAFMRYHRDDYQGAMDDYDYALTLDPLNSMALFNRSLLLMEVSANDLALQDLDRVLSLDPDDYRALYNRAIIHEAKGNLNEAVADITRVHEQFPDFPGALFLRSRIYRGKGDMKKAERDYKAAEAAAKALVPGKYDDYASSAPSTTGNKSASEGGDGKETETTDAGTARRFASLRTVDNTADFREEYNNTAIRGRVQDRNQAVEPEPYLLLSYYSSPTELNSGTFYLKEADELNATRSLRFVVVVTNRIPTLDESTVALHFRNIDYYNSYIAAHTPRAVDYYGRAMDFLTVRDYQSAIKDIDRALALSPDFALGYLMRAQARYGEIDARSRAKDMTGGNDARITESLRMKALDDVLADIDMALRLSPETPVAWFNKGLVLYERRDMRGAIEAFSRAIELKPDFGEAYYNRGFIKLENGLRSEGIADLSRAGEFGIVQAYNIIKRIDR